MKGGRSEAVRVVDGKVMLDKREFFRFRIGNGRIACTKAITMEEAKARIESIMGLENLKEAA